ncbi:MAG: hypothetical protein WCH21_03315 [Bacteroidota bacterium]
MSGINLHNYEAFLIDYLDGNLSKDAVIDLKAFLINNPQLEIDLDELDLPVFSTDEIKVDFKNDLKKKEAIIEDEEIINYLENNLSKVEKNAFELKLLKDKELSNKLAAYKKTVLIPESTVALALKAELHKTEDDLILTNTTLSFFENQLSKSEKLIFEKELKTNLVLQKELKAFQKTQLEVEATILFPNKAALKKEARVIALFSFRTVTSIAAAILLLIGFAFVFNYYNSKPEITKELAKSDFNKAIKSIENQTVNKTEVINNEDSNINEKKNLLANNISKNVKITSIKKDSVMERNELPTNSLVAKESATVNSTKQFDKKVKLAITNYTLIADSNKTLALENIAPVKFSKQNYLIPEEIDSDESIAVAPEKKGFWQKAVKLAKRANKLGVKSVDGFESPNQNYSLSFNSFSVERR